MNRTVSTTAAALLGMAVTALPAVAAEPGFAGYTVNPSSFLNLPATTPPPGLYGSFLANPDRYQFQGPGAVAPATNGSPANGNQPRQQFLFASVESLTYVPGFHFLGGDYSINYAQQEIVQAQVLPGPTATAAGVSSATGGVLGRIGFHDIQITQFLGYKLGDSGFYAKFSFALNLPVGTITGATGLGNVGTPFTTLRPGIGIQYISHGWSFLNNIIAEYNFKNPITGYQSGSVLRDEATLTRTFGRLTLGPAIGWIGQITNDTSTGYYGNLVGYQRSNIVGVGGFIGYDFGPVAISCYGLQDVITTASGGTVGQSAVTRRDTAAVTGGAAVNVQVTFKIPGIGAFGTPLDFAALK